LRGFIIGVLAYAGDTGENKENLIEQAVKQLDTQKNRLVYK